jgi:hypothetical protein
MENAEQVQVLKEYADLMSGKLSTAGRFLLWDTRLTEARMRCIGFGLGKEEIDKAEDEAFEETLKGGKCKSVFICEIPLVCSYKENAKPQNGGTSYVS